MLALLMQVLEQYFSSFFCMNLSYKHFGHPHPHWNQGNRQLDRILHVTYQILVHICHS